VVAAGALWKRGRSAIEWGRSARGSGEARAGAPEAGCRGAKGGRQHGCHVGAGQAGGDCRRKWRKGAALLWVALECR
jgi:hypothetical protein